MNAIGNKVRAVAEGHTAPESVSEDRKLVCHETACNLNPNDRPAEVKLTLLFAGQAPAGLYRIPAPTRRTHLRFNDPRDPEPVPRLSKIAFPATEHP
jgi:hypothetical protein